ncbi:DUF1109 domain-containing protein [Paraburkholderia terrae]|uniref:DUF1109 domain-containing protein n=1 Tax=Paraburkholderia terrae TaxID=311230 RepID=A0A2I8EZL5_9BURK|nr:DUF1109 domain-containing protein [Paraburkholderia terrae]AUT65053.1 DUF1109 domain-containing protein [Paraburkholderia terrae]
METRDLIARLSSNISAIDFDAASTRLSRASIIGLGGNTALLIVLFDIRSDMPQLMLTAMFWIRLAFPLATIVAAINLVERLGRPGARLKLAWLATALPIVSILSAAIVVLFATPPGYRLQLMLGTTWKGTTADIVILSSPSLLAVMHTMKGLAPTRPVVTGAAVGLLAGAEGVLVYTLYCSEMSVPFWSVWYLLAILATAGVAAAIAPRYLKW